MFAAAQRFAVLSLLLLFGIAGTAAADPGNGQGHGRPPKLDPALADASAHGGNVHVLVYGSALGVVNAALGLSPRHSLADDGAESLTVDASQLASLASQPTVQYVAPDTPVAPTGRPSAATPFSTSALQTIYPGADGAPGAWADGLTGAGVGIAIVDSGVTSRADFGNRLVQVHLPGQGDNTDDQVGHGSAVAGVAAGASPDGRYVGVAPGATVYAVDVAQGDGVYTSDVVNGLSWVLHHARSQNIRVVNLSLSESAPSDAASNTLDAEVEALWRAGVVVVCSSGNRGPNTADFAPGNDPFAITVGASDQADTASTADDTLASFSSYGQTSEGVSKPEIVAPGRHVVAPLPLSSTLGQEAPAANVVDPTNGYVRLNGTSFSAPQVAGAAALLLQENPSLTPDQVKWILVQGERPLAGSAAGALDLGRALTLAGSPGSANAGLQYSVWAQPGALTAAFAGGTTVAGLADAAAGALDTAAGTVCAATVVSTQATWEACANAWSAAASAWDAAASRWAVLGFPGAAAVDGRSAGNDWQYASSAWDRSSAWDASASGWASSAWDNAQASFDRSSAWDSSAWDSWEWASSAWDSSAWDSSAWDSSAWDSSAWDSSAWDSSAWD